MISTITLLGTILWGILMFAGGPPAGSFDDALAKAIRLDPMFYLTYLNAAFLVTIPAVILMTLLSLYCQDVLPRWTSLMGLIFVPIYGVLNLFAYLSQITLIPALVEMYHQADTRIMAEALLMLTLQESPGSAVAFFNGLAYSILGIPSIIYGIGLFRFGGKVLRVGAIMLTLNGAACILGVFGSLFNLPVLSFGTVIGGGLFFLALLPMTWTFFVGGSK